MAEKIRNITEKHKPTSRRAVFETCNCSIVRVIFYIITKSEIFSAFVGGRDQRMMEHPLNGITGQFVLLKKTEAKYVICRSLSFLL